MPVIFCSIRFRQNIEFNIREVFTLMACIFVGSFIRGPQLIIIVTLANIPCQGLKLGSIICGRTKQVQVPITCITLEVTHVEQSTLPHIDT